jgi:hypothetical protein
VSRTGRFTVPATIVVGVLASFGGCDKSSPTSPTAVCSYVLSPQEQAFDPPGGSGQFGISTDAACAWSIAGAPEWVTLQSPTSGSGAATVRFTVLENAAEAPREITLTVASQPFRIRQGGRAPCTFAISPEAQSFNANGGSGEVAVSAGDTCVWTAAANDTWLKIASSAGGRGNGTVRYDVAANTIATPRTGTLTIAGRTFTVTESGTNPTAECTYSVTPVSFAPCMPGGSVVATLTTQNACTWTAASDAGWLTVSKSDGTGTATITIGYTDNYDAPRDGVVKLRWPTATAGQNVQVAQAGCSYGVSKTSISFTAAGGTGAFDVLQQSHPIECGGALQDRCVWTAKSSASWVTVTTSMPRMGDNGVAFNVDGNTGAARSATITVRDQVVTISQSGP